ncbi:hypothetical protein X771_32580 [Mesorhizobium sp. LSJC277A00]|nr:hypothetical protein X771_32580 [Mesorhizobium sp. LSJC277A00]
MEQGGRVACDFRNDVHHCLVDLVRVIGNFVNSEYQRQFRPTGRQRPRDQAGLLILGASHVRFVSGIACQSLNSRFDGEKLEA